MPKNFNEISQWIRVLQSHNLLNAVQARPSIWKRLNQSLVDENLEDLQEALEKADFYGLLTDVWTSRFGDKFQGTLRLAGDQSLRRKIVHLAYQKPELRPHLLPLLTK